MIMNDADSSSPSTCKIIQKGRDSSVEDERTPGIQYDISTNQLMAQLNLKGNGVKSEVSITSFARLRQYKWYTVALAYDDGILLLYVNGALDNAYDAGDN